MTSWPTQLPVISLEELDVLRYVELNISDQVRRQIASSGKAVMVCGPCPEATVVTGYDRREGAPTEGKAEGPIDILYTGLAESTGIPINQLTGKVHGSVQSSLVVVYMAQKALVHAICPERYRTPKQNGAIVGGPGGPINVGVMFSTVSMRDIAKLMSRQLAAQFKVEPGCGPVFAAAPEKNTHADAVFTAPGGERMLVTSEDLRELTFKIGNSVRVVGLKSRSDLNGKVGKLVTAIDEASDRVGVQFKGEAVRIKTGNLEFVYS